jgi:YD repeat-containing protein
MRRRTARASAIPALLVALACAVSPVAVGSAQSPAIQYAYDELGRLVAVVDQDGNAAIYVYDAVGNLLAIRRVDAAALPHPVAITAVVPEKGKTGTVVSILGSGFGAAALQNLVTFNGVAAPIVSAATNRIVTTVPAGAVTGPITVTAPPGSAVSPRPFRIVGPIAISPAAATLGTGQTSQFTVTDAAGQPADVVWGVGGVVGGNAEVGTVSALGLYTAPAAHTTTRTVTVTATSTVDVSTVATALVTLRAPLPTFLAATPVGVQFTDPRALAAAPVGVQPSPAFAGLAALAPPVGVGPHASPGFVEASPVSASFAPVIVTVSPAAATRGAADLAVTLTGSGLAGVTALEFLRNASPDPAITVTDLTATPDGTTASARVSIAGSAALGPRVVRVRAQAGSTTSAGTGGNVFTVQ